MGFYRNTSKIGFITFTPVFRFCIKMRTAKLLGPDSVLRLPINFSNPSCAGLRDFQAAEAIETTEFFTYSYFESYFQFESDTFIQIFNIYI